MYYQVMLEVEVGGFTENGNESLHCGWVTERLNDIRECLRQSCGDRFIRRRNLRVLLSQSVDKNHLTYIEQYISLKQIESAARHNLKHWQSLIQMCRYDNRPKLIALKRFDKLYSDTRTHIYIDMAYNYSHRVRKKCRLPKSQHCVRIH